ncbi:MAG: peptidoglycan-binding domain-containing protein, partial [Leucothrix sp.]
MSLNLTDTALAKAFPRNFGSAIKRGSSGNRVVALQYALGRLGFLTDLCDGKFGPLTEAALMAFQRSASMGETGIADIETISGLDNALQGKDFRVAAVKSGDPLAYLSNFSALGLPTVRVAGSEENITWDHRVLQESYGRFVADYWEVMKDNLVEGDCKNIALFLMDQFRKQLKQDTLIDLPHPVLGAGRPEKEWIIATA